MARYRKLPVVIEAWPARELYVAAREDWKALPEVVRTTYEAGNVLFLADCVQVYTSAGWLTAKLDDWIVWEVNGELRPCRADTFTANYEREAPAHVD